MEALKFYIHLFSFLHRPVSLHLKLLQNVGCFSDFAVLLLHLSQNVSETGPLDFNINLFKSERYVDFQDFLEVFEQGEKGQLDFQLTLPAVTVLRVSMSFSFSSLEGI